MTPSSGQRPTLAQQYLRRLLSLFVAFAAVIFASEFGFVMLPLAERSADDLAGLMVLSAQTWAELPPQTRPVFEAELLRTYELALRPGMAPPADTHLAHGFYVRFLEQSLAQRSGAPVFLAKGPGPQGGNWLWTTVTAGGQPMGVGFAEERTNTRPLWSLAVVLLAGTGLAAAAAVWLARRIAQPVARLEQAAAELATGASPALLPVTGSRELADLASHFNLMTLQVRELLDARTTLLAGISHDLRTPLARMRLALELLTLKPSPSLIARLEHDIEEMNALIGQLLDLAKGLDHEAQQTFELGPWLAERALLHSNSHSHAAQAAGTGITVVCPTGLRVQAARGMLGRLVDNLLGNALRYAPGAVELVVQPAPQPPPGRVRLSVLDRGPGIPAEQMGAVWRPFQRVETSRSPQTGGYGLGLAIVGQLAKAQGWPVGLEARSGGGLVAWVELPGAEPPTH
ncbi:MAG: ATP-binding protein [Rubrivivax sp.]|nr:ATP-binding protein [Rubrivivax sp.]